MCAVFLVMLCTVHHAPRLPLSHHHLLTCFVFPRLSVQAWREVTQSHGSKTHLPPPPSPRPCTRSSWRLCRSVGAPAANELVLGRNTVTLVGFPQDESNQRNVLRRHVRESGVRVRVVVWCAERPASAACWSDSGGMYSLPLGTAAFQHLDALLP